MVNRFSQPAQAQFFNTYVPLPYQELQQYAQMRQAKADENLAKLDAARLAMSRLKYIPNSNSKDQAYIESAINKLDTLATNYIDQDLSDPEVYRKMHRELREAVDQNRLQQIQESYAGYENYQKFAAQMQSRGEQIYQPFDFTDYDTFNPEQGIFNQLPTMDLASQAEEAIDDFMTKPEMKWRETSLPSGRIGIEHYRDIEEIDDLIENESGELLNNPAIRQLMERQGMNKQEFKQFLVERAPSYVGSRLTSATYPPQVREKEEEIYDIYLDKDGRPDVSFFSRPSYSQGEIDLAEVDRDRNVKFDGQEYSVEADVSLDSFTPEKRKNYIDIRREYDKKIEQVLNEAPGQKIDFGEGRRIAWRKKRRAAMREMRNLYRERNEKLREYVNKELGDFQDTVNQILEEYPKLEMIDGKKATEEQVWEGYNQIMDDLEQISVPGVLITGAQREAWGEQLADNLGNHSMVIQDEYIPSSTPLTPSSINDDKKGSVRSDLGWKDIVEFKDALKNPKDNRITVSGFSAGDGSEPGQVILEVIDRSNEGKGKGKFRDVYISTHLTNKSYLNPVYRLYHQLKSGKSGIVDLEYYNQEGEAVGARIESDIENVGGIWNYEPKIILGTIDKETGEFVTDVPPLVVSYETIVSNIFGALFKSGALGSDLVDLGSSTAVQ